MTTQFITDKNGKRIAVILPLAEYAKLQEDLQDLAVLAERRDEPTVPFADVVARLHRRVSSATPCP